MKKPLETCVTLCYLFKTKKYFYLFLPFFAFFSTFPSSQTIRIMGLSFFQWAGLSRGGQPPRLYIDSDPPASIGLTTLNINLPFSSQLAYLIYLPFSSQSAYWFIYLFISVSISDLFTFFISVSILIYLPFYLSWHIWFIYLFHLSWHIWFAHKPGIRWSLWA